MRITSVSQAIAAGLLKEAAEGAELTELRENDLVCCKGAVYRIFGVYPKLPGGEKMLLVKRTRDDRGCKGFAPSQKAASKVRRAVADISAICGPTHLQRISRMRVGGYTRPDGTVAPADWDTWYEWKWVTTPDEAKEFILHGGHAHSRYELHRAYVIIGIGRLSIPLPLNGVPAV